MKADRVHLCPRGCLQRIWTGVAMILKQGEPDLTEVVKSSPRVALNSLRARREEVFEQRACDKSRN